jgi:ribonuclease HI
MGPWDITYERFKAIKSQVLADFEAEWLELQQPKIPDMSNNWTMYFDGSKRKAGAGAGVVLISPKGDRMMYVLRMTLKNASNNEAEYEALIHGMRMAKICGATRLVIHGDSNLVVQQTMKKYDAPAENMVAYRELYNSLEREFDGCDLQHVGRGSNSEADVLANIWSNCLPIPPDVFMRKSTTHQ